MTNKDIKSYAKSCVKGNLGKIFPPFFLVFLIEAAILAPSLAKLAHISFKNELLSAFTDIASLFTCVLYVGLADICISVVRKYPYGLSDVFSGTSQFGYILLTNLLAGLFILLKSLLLIVPGIIEAYALSMTNLVRAEDPSLGPKEAIDRSRWLMDGNKFDFFKLQLSFIPWFLLSIVTLGIGAVYVVPYYNISVAAFYENLLMQERALTKPADTPESES